MVVSRAREGSFTIFSTATNNFLLLQCYNYTLVNQIPQDLLLTRPPS